MAFDSSNPIPSGSRPNWRLPKIVNIEIQRIDYQPRKLQHFESALSEYKEAIQFIVHTDGPIPIRALSPALYIGGEQVVESEQLSAGTYRFLAFEAERLETGSAIRWGWIKDAEENREETGFRFELEQ